MLYCGCGLKTVAVPCDLPSGYAAAPIMQQGPCVNEPKPVCGNGRAQKDQVQRMVGALLRLPAPPEPDHAADALAVAICHANGAVLKAAIA